MDKETVQIQKTVFNLDTFDYVTVGKQFDFTPVASWEECLARMGNDANKALQAINDGLRAEAQRVNREDPSGWHSFKEDESGEPTGELNGAFNGAIADDVLVNNLVLTLAKTVFGYNKGMTPEQKKAAKDSAREMIKNSEQMRSGLQKSAVAK